MRIGLIAAILSALFAASCSTMPYRNTSWISPDQAVMLARRETAKLGWMHDNNEILTTVWNESEAIKANKKSPKLKKDEMIQKLKGKNYWKVAFDYKPGTASNDTDAVVYLNRKDGSVFSIYFGEIKGR